MKNFLRLITFLLALIILLSPLPVLAQGATTIKANFENKDLTGEDLSGQDLKEAVFVKVNLNSANLSNADLRGAVFNGVDLTNANLHGVDFSYGFAYVSRFDGADLTDGVFVGVNAPHSSFKNVDITGADFSDAILDKGKIRKLCAKASGVNSQTGIKTSYSLVCNKYGKKK